jgi:hypothetical protein
VQTFICTPARTLTERGAVIKDRFPIGAIGLAYDLNFSQAPPAVHVSQAIEQQNIF